MQLPTHLVAAVVIDKLVEKSHLPGAVKPLVVAISCFLSHGILDKMAKATYHPPDPLDDRFWVIYHHNVLPNITWIVAGNYGPKHLMAMVFSALPDLDWVVRGLSRRYGWHIAGWDKPVMNEGLHQFLDRVPVINQLNRLPDWRFQRKGVLVELGLVASLLAVIQLLDRKKL
jgi:hypothetical protein